MRTLCSFVVLLLTTATVLAQLRHIKTIAVTTTTEGGSARPEIVAAATRVFVLCLGNIGGGTGRTFNVRVYGKELDSLIASRQLVSTSVEYGGPTDIRVASDGQYLYAFYETNKTTSPTTATTYLWGAKYSLNDNFDRVAHTPTPIANSKPMSELQDGGELLDDPAPLVGPISVFVVTRLKYSLARAARTVYRVREFNRDNLLKLNEFDLDLSSVADGRGRVTSLLFHNNVVYMALPTTVSDEGINEATDDGAKSDIVVVRMAQNWSFDPKTDVKTISAEPDDRENYVSGFKTDGIYFYITYKQSVGTPPVGEHRAWMKIFNKDFNLILQEKVRSTVWGPGGGEMRPSLEVIGNRIFSGQSTGQSLGSGNAEVYVYEIQKATSVERPGQQPNLPGTIFLFQNYPNPFNPLTIINYQLPIGNWVTLTVYDLLGREVQTSVNGELNAGEHSVMFTATGLPSGVYFYQLKAGSFIQTKKILITK